MRKWPYWAKGGVAVVIAVVVVYGVFVGIRILYFHDNFCLWPYTYNPTGASTPESTWDCLVGYASWHRPTISIPDPLLPFYGIPIIAFLFAVGAFFGLLYGKIKQKFLSSDR